VTIGARTSSWRSSALRVAVPVTAAVVLVGLSMLLVAPAPSYDPWSWLLWGRELAGGGLDTREGPAFKPLPVGVGAVLAPAGQAAPWLWVGVVRLAALVALYLAFRLGRRLAGGSALAGVLAALGVALCGSFLDTASTGAETPLLLALALGALEAWRSGRAGLALGLAAGCGLVRVEAWPFIAAFGILVWRREPGLRRALLATALLVPALWILPELVGSGDPLRSGTRARVPNEGQPALADVPSLASLEAALRLPLWCLWIGVAVLVIDARRAAGRPALILIGVGSGWLVLVALMAELGFSGEPRYSLPGAALLAIGGAVGLTGGAGRRPGRGMAAVAVALVAVAALPRLDELESVRDRQAHQWLLARDLPRAIEAGGGRDALLACGRTYVGRLRGPLSAYGLDVTKRSVEPDLPPRPPGIVLRSPLGAGDRPTPAVGSGFTPVARAGVWEVWRAC
jgi:hypothetical protein